MFYENVSDILTNLFPAKMHTLQIVTDSDYTYEAIPSYNIKSFSDCSFLPLEVFEKQLVLVAN